MGIQVLEAEDGDMSRIFEIASNAFARNEPFWDATWPKHWTESGRAVGMQRFIKVKHSDPNTKYMKAVDGSSGEILGMAKWNIYNNFVPDFSKADEDQTDYWDNEDDREYTAHMGREFMKQRQAAIRRTNGNVISLDILAIDPPYQRQGVGSALVGWGIDRADELGLEAVVESSHFGKGLYEKNGYVFVKDVELQVPDRWADRPKQTFAWLVRPSAPRNGTT